MRLQPSRDALSGYCQASGNIVKAGALLLDWLSPCHRAVLHHHLVYILPMCRILVTGLGCMRQARGMQADALACPIQTAYLSFPSSVPAPAVSLKSIFAYQLPWSISK